MRRNTSSFTSTPLTSRTLPDGSDGSTQRDLTLFSKNPIGEAFRTKQFSAGGGGVVLDVRVQLHASRGQCVSGCSAAVEAVKRVEAVPWRILYRLTLCSTQTCSRTGLEVFRLGVRRSHQDQIQLECRMQHNIHASTLTSPTRGGWRMQTL